MIIDFLIALGAVGIAVIIFAIVVTLADQPVRALITALIMSYLLYFVYIFMLNRILKHKEGERTAERRYK